MSKRERESQHALTNPGWLQVLDLDVAQAAFIRLRDVRAVELVHRVATGLAGGAPRGLLLADVAAWQGDFDRAAQLFVAEGQLDKVRCAGSTGGQQRRPQTRPMLVSTTA